LTKTAVAAPDPDEPLKPPKPPSRFITKGETTITFYPTLDKPTYIFSSDPTHAQNNAKVYYIDKETGEHVFIGEGQLTIEFTPPEPAFDASSIKTPTQTFKIDEEDGPLFGLMCEYCHQPYQAFRPGEIHWCDSARDAGAGYAP
jgi:hypothetical protein